MKSLTNLCYGSHSKLQGGRPGGAPGGRQGGATNCAWNCLCVNCWGYGLFSRGALKLVGRRNFRMSEGMPMPIKQTIHEAIFFFIRHNWGSSWRKTSGGRGGETFCFD